MAKNDIEVEDTDEGVLMHCTCHGLGSLCEHCEVLAITHERKLRVQSNAPTPPPTTITLCPIVIVKVE